MKKLKFFLLAVVALSAFTFTACTGKADTKKEKTDEEKKKEKDEESEFYDPEATGAVFYNDVCTQA